MRKSLLCGVAAAAVMMVIAGPADAAADPPVSSMFYDWSGFYVGGQLGVGQANFSSRNEGGSASQFNANVLGLSGFTGGVHGGFNWKFDQFLAGIEGDVNFAGWKDSALAPTTADEGGRGRVDLLASVRGRLGFLVNDRTLLYATGGVAFTNADFTSIRDVGTGKVNFNNVGGVVGAGVEMLVSENVSVRAQGLYYIFNQTKSMSSGKFPEAAAGDFGRFKDAFVVSIGVSWHFNSML